MLKYRSMRFGDVQVLGARTIPVFFKSPVDLVDF